MTSILKEQVIPIPAQQTFGVRLLRSPLWWLPPCPVLFIIKVCVYGHLELKKKKGERNGMVGKEY